jgi:5-methylcytosine-specific restriction endonuclease McrA
MTLHYDEQRRRAHEYYQAHAEIMRERARAWRCANPEKSRVWIKQRRAQRRSAPGRYTLADIRALEVAQAGLCAYCRQPYGRYHIEHRQPLCHGGSNWPANLCLACATCNLRKHDKTEEEFRAWLARGYV